MSQYYDVHASKMASGRLFRRLYVIIMTTQQDGSPVPTRARCQELAEMPWYSDAVLTQADFGACIEVKPELQGLVDSLLAFEKIAFVSHDQPYLDLMRVLRYQSPGSTSMVTVKAKVPENGSAMGKLHRMLICYRLLDRVYSYPHRDISLASNIIRYENRLEISKLPDHHYRHIEDIRRLLQEFRTNASPAQPTNRNKSVSKSHSTIYGPRLPQGSGILQQLKDLAALGRNNRLQKIERNFLLTAMTFNWMSFTGSPGAQSAGTSNPHQRSDSSEEEQNKELIAIARNTTAFSMSEVEVLTNMFLSSSGGKMKTSSVHRSAHIAIAITPMFLVAPIELDKCRWSLTSIHQVVLGSPVSRLEKNRDWTGTEPEMTGKLMDRKRPRPRSGPRSNRPVQVGPVWFFAVFENWKTGLGLGLAKYGQKTGLDRTFKHYHQEATRLGNISFPLLKQIESTIFDGVFNLATGSMDVTQVIAHILDNLPWNEIDALALDDPVNVRYRRLATRAPASAVPFTTGHAMSSVASSSSMGGVPPTPSRPKSPAVASKQPVRHTTPSQLVPPSAPTQSSMSPLTPSPSTPTPSQPASHNPSPNTTPAPPASHELTPSTPSQSQAPSREPGLNSTPSLSHTRPPTPTSEDSRGPSQTPSPNRFQPPARKPRSSSSSSTEPSSEGNGPDKPNNVEHGDDPMDNKNGDNGDEGDDDEDEEDMMDVDLPPKETSTSVSSTPMGSSDENDDDDMEVDFPLKSRKTTSRTTSTRSRRDTTKNPTGPRKSRKRKHDNITTKSSEHVRDNTPIVVEEYISIRNTPFPEGIKFEITEPSLEVTDNPVPLSELPPARVFCPEGNVHDVTFRAHNPFMLEFWRTHVKKFEEMYIDGKPLHKANPDASAFTVVMYSVMQTMSTAAKLKLLQRGMILETGRPVKLILFDKKGMRSLQYQSLDGSENMNDWMEKGTLNMLLQCKDRKALNVLDIPMPEGTHSAEDFSSDNAAWWEMLQSPWNVDSTAERPTADMHWGLCATTGAGHTFHMDSDGFGTYIEVITGVKVWLVVRPKDCETDFDLLDIGECSVEAVILTPGTRLYMCPGTMHAAYTSENAICHGGHFYATATMKDTLCGLIQSFVASNYMTNTYHSGSHLLLRRIITFYFEGLEQNKWDMDDPVREHLPKLMPLDAASDDPDVNSMEHAENLFSACCLAIFSNVLDPKTYCHPQVDVGCKPNEQQQEEMERYDRNTMSVEERNACATVRGLAYKLLDWFSFHYRFVPLASEAPSENGSDTRQIFESMLAQQAYAIYLAKQKADEEGLDSFPGCSLISLERQLRGMFSPTSKADALLEEHFMDSTPLKLLHADFSKLQLRVLTPAFAYTPTEKKVDIWVKTPLDCAFEQGFKVDFDINIVTQDAR
ncbi:hypothetical protein BJ912DRAFT_928211 [Pholiota molesta]|nr:hypothetical protein BJ912DRAFT_928211 [Pholiota molesta]